VRARFRHTVICPVCRRSRSARWAPVTTPLLQLYSHRTPESAAGAPVRCPGSGRHLDPVAALRAAS
jgi:hypothetical protein